MTLKIKQKRIGLTGGIGSGKTFVSDVFKKLDVYMASVAAVFAILGYLIIPITNSARDRGWDKLFKWLHNFSVFNTLVIMIIAIIQIFRVTTL